MLDFLPLKPTDLHSWNQCIDINRLNLPSLQNLPIQKREVFPGRENPERLVCMARCIASPSFRSWCSSGLVFQLQFLSWSQFPYLWIHTFIVGDRNAALLPKSLNGMRSYVVIVFPASKLGANHLPAWFAIRFRLPRLLTQRLRGCQDICLLPCGWSFMMLAPCHSGLDFQPLPAAPIHSVSSVAFLMR